MRKAIVAVAAVALAVAASFTLSTSAGAQYPPTICIVTVNPTSVASGATVTLSGTVTTNNGPAAAGSPISFSINGIDLGSTTTDASGAYSLQVTLPALSPGTYTLIANCGPGPDGDILGNTNIIIVDQSTPGGNGNDGNNDGNNGGSNGSNGGTQGGTLARTGTDLGLPVQIAVALLALGGVFLALGASRRRSATA